MGRNTIGIDLAKAIFQAQIESSEGKVLATKTLRRSQMVGYFEKQPPSLIAMEACGTAHYWARVLEGLGHEVKLIPAAYVKPFVKRNKTDARDAAAICAAVGRPDMRFVPIKSEAQQASRALERSRDLMVRQHTQLSNSLRSQLAEFGIISPKGTKGFLALRKVVEDADARLPETLVFALGLMLTQIDSLEQGIEQLTDKIAAATTEDATMRRLRTIPTVGPMIAHAVVAAVGDGRQFASARDFAAWIGLTPLQHSSAGKRGDRGISRKGDKYLRKLLSLGASTLLRAARFKKGGTAWQRGILARRPVKVAVLAQAAKTARIIWAVLTSGQPYRAPTETKAIPAAA